jgi:6-phosphogluconolactonase (cycloisomerase 2 family)
MKVSADGAFLAVAMDTAGPVAVFSIGSNGTLAPVPGSPFYGTFVNATDIDISCAGNFVFAANGTINSHTTTTTVDVFSVTRSGILDLVPGSPFQPGVGVNSNVVLLSPDNRFLFSSDQGLGNDGGDTVTVAVVAADGSLTLVPGSPFSIGSGGVPMGIAMDQTGTLLFTANAPGNGSSIASIGVFRVASDGSLTAVTGAPFAVPGSNLSHIATVPAPVCADGTR